MTSLWYFTWFMAPVSLYQINPNIKGLLDTWLGFRGQLIPQICLVHPNEQGNRSQRPQTETVTTETATNRNGHKPKRPQTETPTNRDGHKPERPQTGTATNRNGHRPERPKTETATSVITHHISCYQNTYDGESPIGNDDIHAKLHRNRSEGWNARTCNSIQVINRTDEANL